MQEINIVWFKRDIRSQDHQPLHLAEIEKKPYLLLYIFDTNLISHPDTSTRHLQFQYHAIQELKTTLSKKNKKVCICYGQSEEIFASIFKQYNVKKIFSYQEIGIQLSWNRDKACATIFKKNNALWIQTPTNGISRGIKNRKDWDKEWYRRVNTPLIENEFDSSLINVSFSLYPIPKNIKEKWSKYPDNFQPAGEKTAWRYLQSFAEKRGKNYSKHISKPEYSRTSCGRISPYLAWGNLSIKQVYQFIRQNPNYQLHKRAYQNFLTRLIWHCHFIQKFENEPSYENECVNSGFEYLNRDNNDKYLEAWIKAKTGYPLIDACMRALKSTGWINFRMRAMLVSFLCHHLDQDWRRGTYVLSKLFLDYEPGIHYPQFQMQAGTTGINTLRIYNPVKQSQDHDPEGKFIKKWIPELQSVPISHIHEPWKMTLMDQQFCNINLGEDYPFPIVDLDSSARKAKEKIFQHKKHPEVLKDKFRILALHTRNTKKKR